LPKNSGLDITHNLDTEVISIKFFSFYNSKRCILIKLYLQFPVIIRDNKNFVSEFSYSIATYKPIPVTARSKAWVCGRLITGIAGSNPARGMDVCLLCLNVVLSCVGRGLCDGLITRPEEPYRVSKCMCHRSNPERGLIFQLGT
jgi:hypothetical protein